MGSLSFALVDAASFDAIPDPAQPGARCQTCDYWERLDGARTGDEASEPRLALKRSRLLAGAKLAGAYAMLAHRDGAAVGYAQFGPMSVYPRAQSIRERYPQLPDSPAPWVVTCLQIVDALGPDRLSVGTALLEALRQELDRRGIGAVEAYPEGGADAWLASPGPPSIYVAAGFELSEGAEVGWDDLLERTQPVADEGDAWPLPIPRRASEDDLFRLPDKPKRTNPFGED